jgi:hypothetical protein
VTAPTSDSTFTRELRAQLVRGAERSNRRRRRSRQLAAGTLVLVGAALTSALLGVGSRPAAAEVEVTVVAGTVTLRLVGHSVTAAEIDRAADGAGLRVATREVPVGPSVEGRLVRIVSDRPLPASFASLGPDGAFTGFRLPQEWPGSLQIDLGRMAEPGEMYARASDAYAHEEPLACSGTLGRPVSEAIALLERAGLKSQVVRGRLGTPATGKVSELVVGDAERITPERVRILALDPGDPPIRTTPPPACRGER